MEKPIKTLLYFYQSFKVIVQISHLYDENFTVESFDYQHIKTCLMLTYLDILFMNQAHFNSF